LLRDRRGTTAVEFAIVGSLFLATVLVILEISLALFTQENLDDAVRDAARQIKIGTLTGTGSSYSSKLTSIVCADALLVPSCSKVIQIYVASAASGSTPGAGFTTLSGPAFTNGSFTSSFATLGPNQDVLLEIDSGRALLFPWIGSLLSSARAASGPTLVAAATLQTEPY
jgi:Flp pilus assembly protein TadG